MQRAQRQGAQAGDAQPQHKGEQKQQRRGRQQRQQYAVAAVGGCLFQP